MNCIKTCIILTLLMAPAFSCDKEGRRGMEKKKVLSARITKENSLPELHIAPDAAGLTRRGAIWYYKSTPLTGYVDEYYDRQILKSRVRYVNGLREGLMMRFFADGQPQERRFYRKNKKHGHHRGWWPDGTGKFDYHFENGIAEGTHRTWYRSGQPYQSFTYLHGKEDGPQKLWRPDGSIKGNYVVRNGHRYGLIGLKNCKSVTYDNSVYEAVAY